MKELQEKVLGYKEEVVKSIQEMIRIKSVKEEPLPGRPFGEGPANALDGFLKLAESLGFKTQNFDNYAGHIDMGEGEETLGILAHVDVVPEGDNWTYPPYSATIADGKIYGRGTIDDKGPAVICLYAMKAIKDSGVKLNKKIRMIIGADEESGSACLKYYFNDAKQPEPTLSFTPDSTFPVTFAEKGIIRIKIKKEFSSLAGISLLGGNAFNSVPEKFETILPKDIIKDLIGNSDANINITSDKDTYKVLTDGVAAHGSTPHLGVNAISKTFDYLKDFEITNAEFKKISDFFNKYIKQETTGASFGINFHDDVSGDLSLNLGKMTLENNKMEIWLDIRCPVLVENQKVIDAIKKISEDNNFEFEISGNKPPLYVPKDSFLVETLMKIYADITGDTESQPIAIGGGTYARTVKNGVAFGALLKSQKDNMHQRDEYLEIDKIDTLLKIYVDAIYKLSK